MRNRITEEMSNGRMLIMPPTDCLIHSVASSPLLLTCSAAPGASFPR